MVVKWWSNGGGWPLSPPRTPERTGVGMVVLVGVGEGRGKIDGDEAVTYSGQKRVVKEWSNGGQMVAK